MPNPNGPPPSGAARPDIAGPNPFGGMVEGGTVGDQIGRSFAGVGEGMAALSEKWSAERQRMAQGPEMGSNTYPDGSVCIVATWDVTPQQLTIPMPKPSNTPGAELQWPPSEAPPDRTVRTIIHLENDGGDKDRIVVIQGDEAYVFKPPDGSGDTLQERFPIGEIGTVLLGARGNFWLAKRGVDGNAIQVVFDGKPTSVSREALDPKKTLQRALANPYLQGARIKEILTAMRKEGQKVIADYFTNDEGESTPAEEIATRIGADVLHLDDGGNVKSHFIRQLHALCLKGGVLNMEHLKREMVGLRVALTYLQQGAPSDTRERLNFIFGTLEMFGTSENQTQSMEGDL